MRTVRWSFSANAIVTDPLAWRRRAAGQCLAVFECEAAVESVGELVVETRVADERVAEIEIRRPADKTITGRKKSGGSLPCSRDVELRGVVGFTGPQSLALRGCWQFYLAADVDEPSVLRPSIDEVGAAQRDVSQAFNGVSGDGGRRRRACPVVAEDSAAGSGLPRTRDRR